ncbi:MAG: twin-arginine translocation signal domain-containing protein, partial [Acidobacteriota bacterium]
MSSDERGRGSRRTFLKALGVGAAAVAVPGSALWLASQEGGPPAGAPGASEGGTSDGSTEP